VSLVTRLDNHGNEIRAAGITVHEFQFNRGSTNIFELFREFFCLYCIYRREKPDLIHHVTVRIVVTGSSAACVANIPIVTNAFTGLGFLFTSQSLFTRFIRNIIITILRFLLRRKNSHVILQNRDDMEMLISGGFLNPEQVTLIRGSGVNTETFKPRPEADGPPVVMLVARMLRDKGVEEFVEAAGRLRNEGLQARFVLVGDIDTENPSAVTRKMLERWQKSGFIEWWGRRDNMPEVYHQAHVVCLPSYREGLPKVLLEAAACGRPIVATDVPGCREVVIDGENGLLVPVKDVDALADALKKLIEHPEMRKQMGAKGRALVEREFSEGKIVRETLQLYGRLLEESQNSRHCEG